LIGGQDGKEYYFYFCIYMKHEGIEQTIWTLQKG
jgi:hypothetical protein